MTNENAEILIGIMREYGCAVESKEEGAFNAQSQASNFRLVIKAPGFLGYSNTEYWLVAGLIASLSVARDEIGRALLTPGVNRPLSTREAYVVRRFAVSPDTIIDGQIEFKLSWD